MQGLTIYGLISESTLDNKGKLAISLPDPSPPKCVLTLQTRTLLSTGGLTFSR